MGWALYRVAQRRAVIAQGHMVREPNRAQKAGSWIPDSTPLPRHLLSAWRCANLFTDTLSFN